MGKVINFTGYHITDAANAPSIKEKGLVPKFNYKHWLGQGVYFYTDEKLAKRYLASSTALLFENCDIKVGFSASILCPDSEYLDLDDPDNLTEYLEFFNSTQIYIKENNIILEFEKLEKFKNDQKDKHIYYRCYVLDAYKEEKSYLLFQKHFRLLARITELK